MANEDGERTSLRGIEMWEEVHKDHHLCENNLEFSQTVEDSKGCPRYSRG